MGIFHPDVSDENFFRAKKIVEAEEAQRRSTCTHEHYAFQKHGRHCTCGEPMADFGD